MPPISSNNPPPPIPQDALHDDLARKRLWYTAAILVFLLLLLLIAWLLMSGMGGGGFGRGGGGGGNSSGRMGTGEGTSLSSSSLPPSSLGNTEGSTSGDNSQPKPNASSPTENSTGAGNAPEADPADESGGTQMALRIYNPTDDAKPQAPATGDSTRPPASGTAGAGKGDQSIESGGSNPFIGSGPPAKSIVYVVDASDSMKQNSRQTRVNEHLIRAIEQLKPEQRFKVYFFSDTHVTDNITKGMMGAIKGNKEKVITWVKQIGTSNGTRPLSAMLEALKLRPELIILLSDGEFDETIIPVITAANKSKTRIDCRGMEENIDSLKEIAKQNKGTYSQVN